MIDYTVQIDAPAEIVFSMLVDADLLTEWMAREAVVDPRPGGEFRWVYENGDVVRGRILEMDAPSRLLLTYGWERPAARGIPPESTTVEITLVDSGGGTLLRLVHRGLPRAEIESHQVGWQFFLARLSMALEATPAATLSTGTKTGAADG